jgi:predicted transglutaminase-like cysteine proteinase
LYAKLEPDENATVHVPSTSPPPRVIRAVPPRAATPMRASALARIGPARALVGAALLACALAGVAGDGPAPAPDCRALDLPVHELADAPTAYADFCRRHPADCRLDGPVVLAADGGLWARLAEVNRAVNAEVVPMSDWDRVGEEEHWGYPERGRGDCEDIALEKRRRFVAAGLPRAAFTMAIVHDRARPSSHAVLLVETTGGSFVLDAVADAPVCWAASGYNFEMRERPDGRWTRYDQQAWTHPAPTPAC